LSQKAVELEGDNPAYVDTLAEIYFQQGNREKAVETQRRCVAIDPDDDLFKERLEHFKTAPLPTHPKK
jgi:predicted Zn-dependent protease